MMVCVVHWTVFDFSYKIYYAKFEDGKEKILQDMENARKAAVMVIHASSLVL